MTSIYQIIMLIIGAVRMLIILHFIMSWLVSFQILNLRQKLVAQIGLDLIKYLNLSIILLEDFFREWEH